MSGVFVERDEYVGRYYVDWYRSEERYRAH